MDGAITPTKPYCNFIDGHSIDDQRKQEQFIVIELCDCCFDSKSRGDIALSKARLWRDGTLCL